LRRFRKYCYLGFIVRGLVGSFGKLPKNRKYLMQKNKASVNLKWFDGYLESISALTAQQISANSQTLWNDTVSSLSLADHGCNSKRQLYRQ